MASKKGKRLHVDINSITSVIFTNDEAKEIFQQLKTCPIALERGVVLAKPQSAYIGQMGWTLFMNTLVRFGDKQLVLEF